MNYLPDLLLVLLAMGTAACGVVLVRRFFTVDDLRPHREVLGLVFAQLGTLYAVLLAFAVYVVWSHFDSSVRAVEKEASMVKDVMLIAEGFPVAARTAMTRKLQAYVECVVNEEWDTMAQGAASPRARAALNDVWMIARQWEPGTSRESALFGECLDHLSSLRDHRSERVVGSRLAAPAYVWLVLFVVGALIIAMLCFLATDDVVHHALMAAVLAGTMALILTLIYELDRPFSGGIKVQPTAFELIRKS
ncbi:MAG: DUF4239 domain-containing protein [Candidatus Riflebacteria bacterium]|nr:DUF4239 domain-containing protein [Candidatus Riflebacteria bacterium]